MILYKSMKKLEAIYKKKQIRNIKKASIAKFQMIKLAMNNIKT